MALVVNDRVKETSTTIGTGTFDLAGAVSGFESFVAGIGNSNTTYYSIVNENGEFEVGLGTITDAATDTLSRDTIISSSNSDSAVNFGEGTKNVFCTLPASKAVILDSSGNIVANNGSNLTNLNADNLASGTLASDRLPTVPTTKGGTGLTTIGTANQVLAVNAGATALEFQTPEVGDITAVTAGDGLTGGGSSGDVTLNVGAGSGISVTADEVAHADTSSLSGNYGQTGNTDGTVTANINLTVDGFGHVTDVQSDNVDLDLRFIQGVTAGTLLDGGGTTGTVTLNVDLSELTTSTSDADGDFFAVVDSANAQKKLTKGNINISGFNNDSGFIDGSALNASNLSSGTVPDARFPATLPAISGANLTSLNATNIASGTLASDRLPTVPTTKGGTGLTAIGTANQVLAVNGAGTALEYQTISADITGVTAGTGLSGGGTSGDVTLNLDLNELTTSTADADGDFFAVVDSVGAQKKLTKANIAISGFNNDSGFIDGSSLNASNLSSGTVPDARFPATLPAISGANLTNLDASDLASGTIPDARFPATLPALNGSALTNLNASNLASGTVPIARIDLNLLTTSTADGDGDFFVVVDSVGAEKKLTKANIAISGFNNDSGFTTNTGTVTSVSGGNGLTGSVTTSGSLAVGAGTGIDVAADSISVDVSDFMSNGSNNRIITATGTDAMNAEANLTFDGSTLAVTGALTTTGNTTTDHVLPNATDTYDLGASDNVWRNVYTGDLHLSNEAKEEGNAVDGTKGNWTIQEGAEHLYILNNKSGKKYRFKLEEM